MVHFARTGTLAFLGALLLLPSASAISIDLLGQGRVDLAEERTACVSLHPSLLDALSLAADACADAGPDGLDVDAAAATSAAGISAVALAAADVDESGIHAGAGVAADPAGIPVTAVAGADLDDDPRIVADARAGDLHVGPVVITEEEPSFLERIGSWLRGIF